MSRCFVIVMAATFFVGSGFAQQRSVTIFLAGDSTMAPKAADKRPETGWGEMLEGHFKPGTVKVDNRAMNGRSTKSFIAEGRWRSVVDSLRAGDVVIIQFGHNDQKEDRPGVYASPEEYSANLAGFARDVRDKGATPVLMTPIFRRRFDESGAVLNSHGSYPDLVRAVASGGKIAMIDLHRATGEILSKYGPVRSTELFLHLRPGEHRNYPNGVEDNTHLSPRGAEVIAGLAVEGIRKLRIDELVKHLRA